MKLQSLSVSDKILVDAYEFMNAIYEDMNQINELISIKQFQALIPEGVCMFYKGFLVVSCLEPKFLSKIILKCKMNRIFEGGHSGVGS